MGRAFLHELDEGNTEAAMAFGRAFLLALGMKGPDADENSRFAHNRDHSEHYAVAGS
ncbi:MAG: hypothetical protein JW880_04435 [Candidatus Thermoplasmatota archaeon]|nr:hypothetical protein [Candidatus Thermoplasmatota archaeon]